MYDMKVVNRFCEVHMYVKYKQTFCLCNAALLRDELNKTSYEIVILKSDNTCNKL